MTLIVYTAPLAYAGDDALDVSRWGNNPLGKAFAPSEMLLNGFKSFQRETRAGSDVIRKRFAMYADCYAIEMRISFKRFPSRWAEIWTRELVTFCCYCRGVSLCHRLLLAKTFEAQGALYEGEREI